MVVNLTSSDLATSQAAFEFARQVQMDNGAVVFYLNLDAAALASTRAPQPKGAVTHKSASDLIAEIVADGGKVYVCVMCLQQSGLAIRDRIEGVALGGPAMREILMSPSTRIMSF